MDAPGMGIEDIFYRVLDGVGEFSAVGRALRIASILAATASIAWLAYTLWDLPVPKPLNWYMGAIAVAAFAGYFVARRIEQKDASYVPFYTVMLAAVVIPMLVTATHFGKSLGLRGIQGAAIMMLCSAWFTKLFRAHVPDEFPTKLVLCQGYFFCVAGLLVLASAVPVCDVLNFRLRIFLGPYWIATGVYAFCHSLGVVRARSAWEPLAGWFSSALTVVFLGGLAWALQGVQPESAPQHARDEAIQELVWENAE